MKSNETIDTQDLPTEATFGVEDTSDAAAIEAMRARHGTKATDAEAYVLIAKIGSRSGDEYMAYGPYTDKHLAGKEGLRAEDADPAFTMVAVAKILSRDVLNSATEEYERFNAEVL